MLTYAVIPAYNEEKTITQVVEHTRLYVHCVIVADDGSHDETARRAEEAGAVVLRHDVNMGKGAALKTGCDYALMNGAECIVVLDADGQHDPHEIPRFLAALQHHDIVFGSRQFTKEMPWILKMGNKGLNMLVRLLYGIQLHDTQSGFRAFTAETYRNVRWKSTDYSMESEMIARAGTHHLSYKELIIGTKYLDRYKGTTVVDGMKIGLNMILWRLRK
jgi:glycosyltransferase involved in cell wall biosynthesis